MGQVLHVSATTTHAVRAELQRSQAPVAQLARRFGINEKTVIKWRNRDCVDDLPMGPKEQRSSVLSPMEEAAIVALRVQARLPPDDVYIALKDVIPQLTRSSCTVAFSATASRGAQGGSQEAREVQGVRDRLLPHRHRRATP